VAAPERLHLGVLVRVFEPISVFAELKARPGDTVDPKWPLLLDLRARLECGRRPAGARSSARLDRRGSGR
jgi:hypothetical protein